MAIKDTSSYRLCNIGITEWTSQRDRWTKANKKAYKYLAQVINLVHNLSLAKNS